MPKNPCYVIVDETDYNIFGAPTRKNQLLASILKAMGGVSDTVPPGTYIFRFVPWKPWRVELVLAV